MKGWVYVISNKAMPGLIKVGFSMKDPEIRAAELNHTGAPHPYVVDYEVLVEDPRSIEQDSHHQLNDEREGKEWFRCSPEDAVAAIRLVLASKPYVENFKRASRIKVEATLKKITEQEQFVLASQKARDRLEADRKAKRQEIMARYEPLLKTSYFSFDNFACAWTLFLLLGTVLYYILPDYVQTSFLRGFNQFPTFFSGALVIAPIFCSFYALEFLSKSASDSPKHKAMLAKRDSELSALASSHGLGLLVASVFQQVQESIQERKQGAD